MRAQSWSPPSHTCVHAADYKELESLVLWCDILQFFAVYHFTVCSFRYIIFFSLATVASGLCSCFTGLFDLCPTHIYTGISLFMKGYLWKNQVQASCFPSPSSLQAHQMMEHRSCRNDVPMLTRCGLPRGFLYF